MRFLVETYMGSKRQRLCMARSYEKDQWLLDRYGVISDECLMVGNSFRSDILPVIEIGGSAVHVPYEITWEHESVSGALPDEAVTVARLLNLLDFESAKDEDRA